MGPQSEGGPSGEGRSYGGQTYTEDGRRYQSDRDIGLQDQQQQLARPNGAFGIENRMTASPAGSTSGKDRDGDSHSHHKTSGERNRSRTRNGRTTSGQLRICKKCGEPLTGQFVRALGGTFHLDCFRCRVGRICCICAHPFANFEFHRIVDKLLRRNSSQSMKRMEKVNIRCAKPTTFDGWISYATNAMERFADRT